MSTTRSKTPIEKEIAAENPFTAVKTLPNKSKGLKYFKQRHQNAILSLVKERNMQLYHFVLMIQYCFVRPKELRHLLIGDIDIDSGYVQIRAEISKNKKTQTVPIPQTLLKALEESPMFAEFYPDDYFLFGKEGKASKEQVNRDYFYKIHREILEELDLQGKGYSLYSWKHTGAVNAVRKGANAKQLQMQMRHHSLMITDTYIKEMIPEENTFFKNL